MYFTVDSKDQSTRGGTESGHLHVRAYVSAVCVYVGITERRDEGKTLPNLSKLTI